MLEIAQEVVHGAGRIAPSLEEIQKLVMGWSSSRPVADLITMLNQQFAGQIRKTRKSMSRRKGQRAKLEQHGSNWSFRVRLDIPGIEGRVHQRITVCPIKRGEPGWLNSVERQRKADELMSDLGANSEERFNEVVLGASQGGQPTFGEQSAAYLHMLETRTHPARRATIIGYGSALDNWILPLLGKLPLGRINNGELKRFVRRVTANGLLPRIEMEERMKGSTDQDIAAMSRKPPSPVTVRGFVKLIKQIVASCVDDDANQLFPRKWDDQFIDLPELGVQNTPSFRSETMSGLANYPRSRERTLFVLLGATGLRIGEALGIEIDKHLVNDFRTILVEQKVRDGAVEGWLKTDTSYRQVDVHPAIAEQIRQLVGNRKSGLLFSTASGAPLRDGDLIRKHLRPALEALGYINDCNGSKRAGFHAFRRFRNTYLRNYAKCPEGLRQFWLGHAGKDMGDLYDKIRFDLSYRLQAAEDCGFGFELPAVVPTVPMEVPVAAVGAVQHATENTGVVIGGAGGNSPVPPKRPVKGERPLLRLMAKDLWCRIRSSWSKWMSPGCTQQADAEPNAGAATGELNET